MIEKMTKYTFLLLQSEKDEFLDRLQELGVVDISRSSKPVDTESASILEEIETLQARVKQIAKGMDPTLEKMLAEENQLVKYKREIAVWGEYGFLLRKRKELRSCLGRNLCPWRSLPQGRQGLVRNILQQGGFPYKGNGSPEDVPCGD